MKKAVLLTGFLLVLFAAPLFAAAPSIQEGKWEIVTSIAIEGVPFSMPPMKTMHCYTKKELADSSSTRPGAGGSGKKNDCEIKDLVETGTSATWKMVCKDGSSGSGEATYQGNVYTTTLKMKDKSGGGSSTNIKAKRVGNCD